MASSLCITLIAVLAALSTVPAAAQRGGKGGKGGDNGCKSPCADGSKPACPDGSKPDKSSEPPTCPSGGGPLCKDGSSPQPQSRKLQGRGGKGDKRDDDDDDCDEGLAGWQIAAVSVVSVGAFCCLGGGTCYAARRCRSAQQPEGNKGMHTMQKAATGTNAADSTSVVLGQPVVCVAKVACQENVQNTV